MVFGGMAGAFFLERRMQRGRGRDCRRGVGAVSDTCAAPLGAEHAVIDCVFASPRAIYWFGSDLPLRPQRCIGRWNAPGSFRR